MATTYKTPGVYVEEISIFPPSVAQVATAIPAFIGYTKKAKENVDDDLLNVPTKISSVLDFVTYFGGAPEVDITTVELDALNQVTTINLDDKYYLYECIRMFYANGGGDCYIVSVGKYGETVILGDGDSAGLWKGLNAVKKVDEPTILVAPDAPLMSQTNMNSLYQQMLDQCNDLGDRFAILDTKENTEDHDDAIQDFRNGIGMNYLKYGAVYSPWLKANLPREVNYSDIKGNITVSGSGVNLSDLVTDADAKTLADELDELVDDQAAVAAEVDGMLSGSYTALDNQYQGLANILKGDNSRASLINLLQFYADVIDFIRDAVEVGTAGPLTISHSGSSEHLLETIQASVSASVTGGAINDVVQEIIKMEDDSTSLTSAIAITSATGINYDTDPTTATTSYFGTGTTNVDRIEPHVNDIVGMWSSLKSAVDYIVSTTNSFVDTYEDSALEAIPALKSIYRAISAEYLTLPPSATLAGVYARVDNERGVWKAPANTSLSNVVGVTTLISKKDQEDLNIPNDGIGKSVNAIRPFTGKGIMVWGARTLAGNDNEWRYISVRRFFNMAEESIKKATEPFVFEPNDKNTWVKVRAMIENFLTLQWRAGALAGAKPDQAFFVRVGLGETMTADDILNGRMNIEIGMAVVRPAEFIILKFSHKMQES